MGEWPTVPLRELLLPGRSVSYGIVQPGKPSADGVPIVRVSDIRGGRVDETDPLRVAHGIAASYSRTRLAGGELLMTLVGTVGEMAIAPPTLAGWNVARAVAVIPVRPDPGARWVQLALGTRHVSRRIDSRLNTTVQATLNLGDVAELPVLMPPKAIRDWILGLAFDIDRKVETNIRIADLCEAICKNLFRSWFVDFDPLDASRKPEATHLPKHLQDLFPDHLGSSALGEIPAGWRATKLDEVLQPLISGSRPKGGAVGSGVPSVGAENVVGLGRYDYAKEKYIPRPYFHDLRARGADVRSGDVLLYKDGAHVGRKTYFEAGFPHEECAVNEHVFILRTRQRALRRYLYLWLDQDWMTRQIESLNTGSAQPGINQPGVRSLPLLLPPPDLITAFDRIVGPLFERIARGALEIRTLSAIRATLVPRLMSGEIPTSMSVHTAPLG